ncbi:MAG: TIGR04552 family protein [Oligoflexales bacterium]
MQKESKKWSFNWEILESMIGGKSAIDLPSLRLKDLRDATQFLVSYGFDPEKDKRHIHSVIVESLYFIQRYLMPEEWDAGMTPPPEILYADDIRPIILLASSKDPAEAKTQAWACAVLRVMHTIAHIEGVYRIVDIEIAREQIMSRFQKFIFTNEDGTLCFGITDDFVELEHVEWKHEKARNSIILKLLHKRGNVAENIYDLFGVRIITKTLPDVLLVVKYLKDYHIITFPNANPARARNTLVDVEQTQRTYARVREALKKGEMSEAEYVQHVKGAFVMLNRTELEHTNPHTGSVYQSIQITCRQLIRYPDPIFGWADKLESILQSKKLSAGTKNVITEFIKFAKNWGEGFQVIESSNFFPFEVHVVDAATAELNRTGDASHDKYKLSQLKAARRRVLQPVFTLYREPKL